MNVVTLLGSCRPAQIVRRSLHLAAAGLVISLGAASLAPAHHSILIREVRASSLTPGSAFVELQTYRQGQNTIAGAQLVSYDQSGLATQSFPLAHDVANAANQRTILIGGSDLAATADFSFAGLGAALSPSGGAVCLPEAAPPDCVSWGAFSGSSLLPFPGGGSPAPAIAEGQSLTRSIARGCALGLGSEDDTNSSALDFSLGVPTPRSNAVVPTERDCVPCGGADATLIGDNGTDVLRGTAGRDVIAAMAGPDTVKGFGGNDVLCGGIGKDILLGGKGRDRLIGERGWDTCRGGRGRDAARSCESGS